MISISKANVEDVANNCERLSLDSEAASQQACPLCGAPFHDASEWKDHIAHHLEQFALTAIGEDECGSDEGSESHELLEEFVDEQERIYAQKSSQMEHTVVAEVAGGSHNSPDVTESSNIFGDVGENHNRKAAQDYWQDKVGSYLEQAEPDKVDSTVWINVPERNDEFVGRQANMKTLHDFVSQTGHICVMSGRGGIGKTATAVEYSHRYHGHFAHIIFVEAESSGGLADKYNRVGTEMFALENQGDEDPLSVTLSVREKLGRCDTRWLLIFDNVEAWEDISRYIPRRLSGTNGSVLITTREQDLVQTETTALHRMVLEPLTSTESAQFLLCSIDASTRPESAATHPDYKLAGTVSRFVECLPLALIMVAGYIQVSRATLDDFLEIWEEKQAYRSKSVRRSRLITEGTLDTAIDLLWDIGISELSVPARNLLEILAFLDPDKIPQTLLVGDHSEVYLEFLNSTEAAMYKRMIRQLSGRKLIEVKAGVGSGRDTYRIHRLLQRKIILDISVQLKFNGSMRKATRLVRKLFPKAPATQEPAPQNWRLCREAMPHVFSLLRAYRDAQKDYPTFERHLELAELFYDAGFFIWDRDAAEYDGLLFLNAAEAILDHIGFDPNAKLRADIQAMSGLLRNSMGCKQRTETLRRLKLARDIRRHIFAENPADRDSDMLLHNAATDYGIVVLNEYEFAEAETIFEDCLARYKVWGEEDDIPFEYSKYYYNTGIVRMWQGRMQEAVSFLETSVRLVEKHNGGKKGQYWDNLFMLACIVLQSGDIQMALDLHLEILAGRIDASGPHANSTILSTYAVGAMYDHIGDRSTAIQYLEQCIEIATSTNWPEERLGRAQFHLANLYNEVGVKPTEAAELEATARDVLLKCEKFLSPWIQETADPIMMFNDLQPTDEGRYTGSMLIQELWRRRSAAEAQSSK